MRMVDLINKKREGEALTSEEIHFMIKNHNEGKIPDYQMSAMLMAIYFQKMTNDEIVAMTDAMLHSGDVIDLSSIQGIKVDKHSTGGVGDKTSLVLGPLVASCGAVLAKMSGRGLGHTGGTLDKMESIPGMRIDIAGQDFINQVNKIGMAIVGQTGKLVPSDKKLYALRDVTGTVESIPLIASSIMSKKLASGTDCILLDVKFGQGAFMKDLASARELAKTMVNIGKGLNRDTRAILTDMDQPLGMAVGNSLEVIEAIETLQGKGPRDLVELCLEAGSIMLIQAKICSNKKEARALLQSKIDNGEAFEKFVEFVKAQGGDESVVRDISKFKTTEFKIEVTSKEEGYLQRIDALEIGENAMRLGAGRETIEDKIDMAAGVILKKKVGDVVKKGEILCVVYTNKKNNQKEIDGIHDSFKLTRHHVKVPPIVHEVIE